MGLVMFEDFKKRAIRVRRIKVKYYKVLGEKTSFGKDVRRNVASHQRLIRLRMKYNKEKYWWMPPL